MSPRQRGFVFCSVAYMLALGAAVAAARWLVGDGHPLLVVGVADLVGTVVVFGFSVALNNSSVYDPYWSVAPVPIGAYHIVTGWSGVNHWRGVVTLVLVAVWSARLTHNWARSWRGPEHEDWRYVQIRAFCGVAYWPVSFLGIHLMPTVMVYLGCLPLGPALTSPRSLTWLDGVALVVTAAAIGLETVADLQLLRFKRGADQHSRILNVGLWRWSRHPNYFGEILFWWGLYLVALAAAGPRVLWTGVGAAAITLLFLAVSLPLIERRMVERHADYQRERRCRSLLIPWFPRER